MALPRDPTLLLHAAQLYYVEGKSQAEVAEALGTGRPNVSRILAEAQRRGIVEIRINDPAGRERDLEDALTERFGLTEVRVARRSIGGDERAGDHVAHRVGTLAAGLLVESLKDDMVVALSWGRALRSMVHAVTAEHDHEVTLVQLLGGMSAGGHGSSGQELVRELGVRLGAPYRLLHAPAALESLEACRSLLAESSIAAALRAAREADLAFVGVGTPHAGSSAEVLTATGLGDAGLAEFWAAAPVGDLAGRFFTADGSPVPGPVDDRVVAVTLDDLDRIPQVVAVVSGRAKTTAVLGALRGHHVDALVCDESLARSVLSAVRHDGDEPVATSS